MWRAEGLMVPFGTSIITRQNVWHPFLQLTRSNSKERRKRKLICWACHQAFASFRCGMWNFLSRRLLTEFSCICRGAWRSKISPIVRQICSVAANSYSMPHIQLWANLHLCLSISEARVLRSSSDWDFWRVDSSARNHHSWCDTFIDPLSTFTRSENQRK